MATASKHPNAFPVESSASVKLHVASLLMAMVAWSNGTGHYRSVASHGVPIESTGNGKSQLWTVLRLGIAA